MNKLQLIKATAMRVVGRSGLTLKQYSPEILMGVGVIGIVAGTVLACRATLKVESVIEEAQEKIEKIKYASENVDKEKYSDQDYKKDMAITYVQTGVKFVKLYGPAILLGVASISCILGSNYIMRKRNLALMAAYKAIEGSFKDYRRRVVEEFGEDKDRELKYGVRKETFTNIEDPEDTKTVTSLDPNQYSSYARFFDEASPNWSKTPEYNMIFLKCQQNYANDMLKARGHVFLNEVYDALGIPRSQAGAIVGWVLGKDGDNFIDFGIFNQNSGRARDFVNGYERSILLDFNVDGVIYDLL